MLHMCACAAFLLLFASPVLSQGAGDPFLCAGMLSPGPGRRGAAKPAVDSGDPSTLGTRHAVVIFAKFKGEDPSFTQAPVWAADLFDADLPGSFTHFYDTMSGGQLHVTGEVVPRVYESQQPASAYLAAVSGESGGYGRFAREVLEAADADVDFARFNTNGADGMADSGDDDEWVDVVFIALMYVPDDFIIAGAKGVGGMDWDDPYRTDDTRTGGGALDIRPDLCCLLQTRNFGRAAGLMAHEFGHVLGLPDLYNAHFAQQGGADPSQDSAGIGKWGLMGMGWEDWSGRGGPLAFCAWSLAELGWLGRNNERLIDVQAPMRVTPGDAVGGGNVYRMGWPTGDPGTKPHYLLEWRTRDAHHYNRDLPNEGLLIWSVNDGAALDLECADGLHGDAGYPLGKEPAPDSGQDNLDFWAHDAEYCALHGGNIGDATDMYDGRTFSTFNADTNPSCLPKMNSGPFSSPVLQPLSVQVVGSGASAQLEIRPSSWAGVISEDLQWPGTILVDGDVRIAPQGRLTLWAGTRVLIAGTDRLHQGRDPDRVEFTVEGDLVMKDPTGDGVTFANAVLGEQWYGMVLDPEPGAEVTLYEEQLNVVGSMEGIVPAYVGAGYHGLAMHGLHTVDDPTGARAGNRDGQLQPGESFQVALDMDNGSWRTYHGVVVSASWDAAWVSPTWPMIGATSSGRFQRMVEVPRGLDCGPQLPCLTVRRDAPVGQEITVAVSVDTGEVWTRTHTCRVQPGALLPHVVFSFGDEAQRVTVVDSAQPVRVCANGAVEAAQLVTCEMSTGRIVEEMPMETVGGADTFEALWRAPDEGEYAIRVRATTPDGACFFARGLARVAVVMGQATIVTAVEDEHVQVPACVELRPNYPNPFNASTTFGYDLSQPSHVELTIYNLLGQRVTTLVSQDQQTGTHIVVWEGRDDSGHGVASAVYLYRLRVGEFEHTRRLLVLR